MCGAVTSGVIDRFCVSLYLVKDFTVSEKCRFCYSLRHSVWIWKNLEVGFCVNLEEGFCVNVGGRYCLNLDGGLCVNLGGGFCWSFNRGFCVNLGGGFWVNMDGRFCVNLEGEFCANPTTQRRNNRQIIGDCIWCRRSGACEKNGCGLCRYSRHQTEDWGSEVSCGSERVLIWCWV